MTRPRSALPLALLLAAAAVAWHASAAARARIHTSGKKAEEALLAATRAFAYGDLERVREALERLEASCARLATETDSGFPARVVNYDRAFHLALDTVRELAVHGDLERSFEQFFWIQRGCRQCHDLARDEGLPGVPAPPQERQSRG